MAGATFRLVCAPESLRDAPAAWAEAMLDEGELALLGGDGGLEEIGALAHQLGLVSLELLRAERSPDAQEDTVMTFAGSLPLVWVAGGFSARARGWAQTRGPMTLLVEADGPLPDPERRRMERFVAALGRQSE